MSSRLPSASGLLTGKLKAGGIDEIDAAARYAGEVRVDSSQYGASARGAGGHISGAESQALICVQTKIVDRLLPGAEVLQQSASDAKSAFNSYASAITVIHAEADQLSSRVDSCLRTIGDSTSAIARISLAIRVPYGYQWNIAPSPIMPEPRLDASHAPETPEEQDTVLRILRESYETEWRNAALAWQGALDTIGSSQRRWRTLIEERGDAERRLVGALDDTPVGQLITLGAGMPGGRRQAIAVGLTGEIRGRTIAAVALGTRHPLLRGLLGTDEGAGLWDAPPDPVAVGEWWSNLRPEQRDELISQVPTVIGNLPGLPFTDRDRANRVVLDHYRRYPSMLDLDQLKLMAEIQRVLNVEASQGVPDPPIQLIALSIDGSAPKAAVGYGDLDTATHATWNVPGMDNDAPVGLPGWDQASRNLYRVQGGLLDGGGSQAIVAWLGYDTPDPPPGDFGVLSAADARAGAARLVAELDGMHVTRSSSGRGVPVMGVVAHSYGTTVATIALTSVKHPVDTLVMLGSAGLDTERVSSLDVLRVKETSPGQKAIYTTNARGDHLAPAGAALAGRALPNPDATALGGIQNGVPVYGGALSFSSEGDLSRGLEPTDGHSTIGEGARSGPQGISASEGHGYMDIQTQALHTTAKITAGRIDPELGKSFTVTQEQRVEMVYDLQSGIALPRRVGVE